MSEPEAPRDGLRECPRCAWLGTHTLRRTRYGRLVTCVSCGVAWLIPAVEEASL